MQSGLVEPITKSIPVSRVENRHANMEPGRKIIILDAMFLVQQQIPISLIH